jgi:hypothetical protein
MFTRLVFLGSKYKKIHAAFVFFSGGGICSTTCKYDERENDINIMCTTTTSALFYDSFPYYLNGSIHPHTHKSFHSNRPLSLSCFFCSIILHVNGVNTIYMKKSFDELIHFFSFHFNSHSRLPCCVLIQK